MELLIAVLEAAPEGEVVTEDDPESRAELVGDFEDVTVREGVTVLLEQAEDERLTAGDGETETLPV